MSAIPRAFTLLGSPGLGTGDVVGPASATDNAIVRFDGTTGKGIQNSGCTIDDSNNMMVGGNLTAGSNISPGAGSFIAGSLYTDANQGFVIGAKTGVTRDFLLADPSGNAIIGVATGTKNVTLGGNLTVSGAVTSSFAGPVTVTKASGADSYLLGITTNDQSGNRIRLTNTGTSGETWSLVGGNPGLSNAGLAIYQESGTPGRAAYFTQAASTIDGNLTVSSTATSTGTTSGAVVIGTNIGLSGSAGGASFFGGSLSMGKTLSITDSSTTNPNISLFEGATKTGLLSTSSGVLFLRTETSANLILGTNQSTRVTIGASTGDVTLTSSTDATTGGAGSLTTSGGIYATKALINGGVRIVSTDTLSGAGAVSVTKDTTKLTSTGAGQAITLADGTDGQIKHIIHDVDGGSMVLTPTTKTGYTTITFTNAGDAVTLEFVTTRGWIVVGSFGVTIA